VLLLIPSAWLLLARLIARAASGAAAADEALTLRYGKRYILHTAVIPWGQINDLCLHKSIFQRFLGGCDLLVRTRAGKAARLHRVQNLDAKEAGRIVRVFAEKQARSG
jgi:uncharacterized membrane protein YdbT with pleckstrin-like domain